MLELVFILRLQRQQLVHERLLSHCVNELVAHQEQLVNFAFVVRNPFFKFGNFFASGSATILTDNRTLTIASNVQFTRKSSVY